MPCLAELEDQAVLELVEMEELPPVFAAEEIRLEMSGRFKAEGNEKSTAGDHARCEQGGRNGRRNRGVPTSLGAKRRSR